MKEFTEDEKVIARNIDKKYKWMTRDSDGYLRIYEKKPNKIEYKCRLVWNTPFFGSVPFEVFDHVFRSIKWEDDEPTLIRDIYDPQVLDDVEREYLKTILKPFHEKVVYVEKLGGYSDLEGIYYTEYLHIEFYDGEFTFPDFDRGKMYAGMQPGKEYKLDELGITYTDDEI